MTKVLPVSSTLVVLFATSGANAWIFPEHTKITRRAYDETVLRQATPSELAVLDTVVDVLGLCGITQSKCGSDCPTLAVLPSLAGDHSCSPAELLGMVQSYATPKGSWVKDVLDVGDRTEKSLVEAGTNGDDREDVRRGMHISLQGADARYVERALLDFSHFQLARESGRLDDLVEYAHFAVAPSREANATAAYINYHVAAIRLAAYATWARTADARRDALERAWMAEAFANHFLEDSFSSGHIVGHWGSDALRLGTHDAYSRAGVVASRWRDPAGTFVVHGDAFLTNEELAVAAQAVGTSVLQVLKAAADPHYAASIVSALRPAFAFEQYDSCKEKVVPPALGAAVDAQIDGTSPIRSVLEFEPIPSDRSPPVPRVQAEDGVFLGGAATVGSGYAPVEEAFSGNLRATLRFGYGATAIEPDPINAQAFVDVGLVGEALARSGRGSMVGLTFRARAPGYAFLLDGGLAIALAAPLKDKCPACVKWAAGAAGGGFFRLWKTRRLYGAWNWQLSALRDATLNLFLKDSAGQYQTEVLAPFLTARNAVPIAGEGLAQSTDLYFDVGPSLAWSDRHSNAYLGVFASLSVATRVFP